MTARSLEPTDDELAELLVRSSAFVRRFVAGLPRARAVDTSDVGRIAALARGPMPETGEPLENLLAQYETLISKGYNTASGGALSYVTGGGLVHAAIADMIAGATNPYVAYWGAGPGAAELERTVIRWFCDLLRLGPASDGVLLSGGSMANLTALVAARRALLGESFLDGVLYASDQVHHSVRKAAVIAGFPERSLRVLPSNAAFQLPVEALKQQIRADRAAGARPFLLVASAGTTNTGAVDDLAALAELATAEGLWLHVDAAYGGFFSLTERGASALRGIERADSIVLDPHKSLFLPFGTGCLLVRDVDPLRRAHQLHSEYIAAAVAIGQEADAVNFGDLSTEMSRDFRGLRLWLPIKLLGIDTFRRALDEKLDLAREACEELARRGFHILAPPTLSILAFRATRPAGDEDALNRRILARVNRKGRVHLSATELAGRFALRICVLAFRTHRAEVEAALDDLVEARDEELALET